MEITISSPITTVLLLFLLLATPCFASNGGSENGGVDSPEVYEIDYRGPETHSSHLSPPDHSSHGRRWTLHPQPKRPHLTTPKPQKTSKVEVGA